MWDLYSQYVILACDEFSNLTRGQHQLSDVEHIWSLGFAHGTTCSDTIKKVGVPL